MQLGVLRRQLHITSDKLRTITSISAGTQEEINALQRRLTAATAQIQGQQAHIASLQTHCRLLNAEKGAAEAHCTLRTMENTELRQQLEGQKHRSKRQRIRNTAGRFLTLPQAQAAFHTQQEERATQLALETEKQAERTVANRARELQRAHNAIHKTFDAPLGSYKRKDDLKDIAAALALDQQGTVPQLISRCRDHLTTHPGLSSNPRFACLFTARRPRTQAHSGETSIPYVNPPSLTPLPCAVPIPTSADPSTAMNVNPPSLTPLPFTMPIPTSLPPNLPPFPHNYFSHPHFHQE